MSPIAGVGINLAIQDAVAAANLLTGPLRAGTLTDADLAKVQRRRALPTRLTQRVQLTMQRQIISAVADPGRRVGTPRALRLVSRMPPVLRLLSRFPAIGVRNEHVAAASSTTALGRR